MTDNIRMHRQSSIHTTNFHVKSILMRCRVIKVQIGQFRADGVETQALKSITSGRVQPDLWMMCVAAQMPHLNRSIIH